MKNLLFHGLSRVGWVFFLSLASAAQSPDVPLDAQDLPPEFFRVPLHTDASSEAGAGVWWTALETYKARFEDGFEFYPALGASAPDHLPLRWRTESIAIGGVPLDFDATRAASKLSDWSLRYVHAGWSEIYDILPGGLEQSFVIEEPRALGGDLLIRARIDTPLFVPECDFAHQALCFYDEHSRAVLRYGEAKVFDAAGRVAEVETRYVDSHIELRVAEAWLCQAQFPIRVDPLTSAIDLGLTTGNGGTLNSMASSASGSSIGSLQLVAFTRTWTANDCDVFAVQFTSNFTAPTLIYAAVDAATSETQVSATCHMGTSKWIIATQHDAVPPGAYSRIRLYVHALQVPTLNQGTVLSTVVPAAESHRYPSLGGAMSLSAGPEMLLAFQSDAALAGAATNYSEARYAILNTQSMTLTDRGSCSATSSGVRYDREHPAVSGARYGSGDGWVVVWSELDRQAAQDDWDVRAMRTDLNGMRSAEAELVDMGGSADAIQPKVAGQSGHYLVCFSRSAGLGQGPASLRARCFEWPLQQAVPQLSPERIIGVSNSVLAAPRCSDIAFDVSTQSHWMIAATHRTPQSGLLWRTVAEGFRVGGSAAVVDSFTLFNVAGESALPPTVSIDMNLASFAFSFGSITNAAAPARMARWTRPSDAGIYNLGLGCGTGFPSFATPPLAGNKSFSVYLLHANSNVPAVLLLSAAPANLSLDALGMTGCAAYIDLGLGFLGGIPVMTDGSGVAEVGLPLPDAPLFVGDFYFQWLHGQPSANALGFAMTRGQRAQVR